jgi:hypothetical protein
MGGLEMPLLWAQAVGGGAASPAGAGGGLANPAAMASLAFRRWSSGLTLSAPQAVPSLDVLWPFLAGIGVLLVLAVVLQGPLLALKQLVDLPGHIALIRLASQRVWRAGRLVAAAITVTVLAWTGSQTLGFLADKADRGKAELTLLTRSRSRLELALEQGILAGSTPLRDLAGLGDNLPLLVFAVYLVFRASSGMMPVPGPIPGRPGQKPSFSRMLDRSTGNSGWSTWTWGCGSLYILYRLVARASGSVDLPLGGCLVAEAVLVPLIMIICDGFLLAWVLAELRRAGFDDAGEDRFHPAHALELMPAACLGCALALPARYVGTLVFLVLRHLPTSIGTTSVGRYIRWQFGWGLIDLQGASLVVLGLVGVVAWSCGSPREVLAGLKRLLQSQGGHLTVAIGMAGVAACALAGLGYSVVLLLPPAGWVLPAADSYAHYATLPIGLWTLAALIELAQRSLPMASLATDAEESSCGEYQQTVGDTGTEAGKGLASTARPDPGMAGLDG